MTDYEKFELIVELMDQLVRSGKFGSGQRDFILTKLKAVRLRVEAERDGITSVRGIRLDLREGK